MLWRVVFEIIQAWKTRKEVKKPESTTPEAFTAKLSPPIPQTKVKPWLWIGLGIVIVILLASYSALSKQTRFYPQPLPTSLPLATVVPVATRVSLFQEILVANCHSGDRLIALDKIPIEINQSVIKVKPYSGNEVLCYQSFSDRYPQTLGFYLEVEYDEGRTVRGSLVFEKLYIHDGVFVDEGYGGYPYMQLFGTPIDSKGERDIKISVFLATGERGTIVGESPVILRGIKTLHLFNDETFYITTDRIAIEGNDQRLIQLLTNYSEACDEIVKADLCVSLYEEAQEAVVKRFFNNTSSLEGPEKDNLVKLKQILHAISAKS